MTPAAPTRLADLLAEAPPHRALGDVDVRITAIASDTADVVPGALFCCVRGRRADGHDLADQAVASGAAALLVDHELDAAVPQVVVEDVRPAIGPIAAALHGHPSREIDVVGVTGTNGKTTTTQLVRSILEADGRQVAVIGNLDHSDAKGPLNTPEAPVLQRMLAEHRDAGRSVVMEVTSLALARHRVDGTRFRVAAFTNLTQDHLDEHGSMEAYFEAKARLFEGERCEAAVIDVDGDHGRRLADRVAASGVPVTQVRAGDAAGLVADGLGSRFSWRGCPVELRLGGRFNVRNALLAAAIAAELGVADDVIAAGLSAAGVPRGRFEPVHAGQPFTVLVDYAHTPDGIEQVLSAARELTGPGGRLIVVFGCGGDRDRTKRPLMGRVATELADEAILTSDNPRGEDPMDIIDEARAGVARADVLRVEPDRAAAIDMAVAGARPGDVVVIAGKGHEQGQEVAGVIHPFDDRSEALAALARRGWGSAA